MNSTRLVSCITTLFLFSKIRAQLIVKHAMTMQPYLTTKCNVRLSQRALVSHPPKKSHDAKHIKSESPLFAKYICMYQEFDLENGADHNILFILCY